MDWVINFGEVFMKKYLSLILLLVVAAGLSGCGRKGIVNVNGQKVQKSDFYARLENVPVQTKQGARMAGDYVIEQIINEELIKQFAKEKGVEPTKEQIDKKIAFLGKQTQGGMAMLLRQSGMTKEELQRKVTVEQSLINVIAKGITVSNVEAKKAYDQALTVKNSPFKRPDQVMISIIATKTKDKIDKAYQELKKGTPFGTVASTQSEHPTKVQQGKVGAPLSRGIKGIPANILNAAFGQNVGDYTAPIKDVNEWIIVKTDVKRPARVTPYDEVRDAIKEQIALAKGNQKGGYKDDLQKYIKDAKITVNAERYKKIPENIKKIAAAPEPPVKK